METMNVAILGCGTVGGGVAQIITEMNNELAVKANKKIELKKIVELNPTTAAKRFKIPIGLFCGGGKDLTPNEANQFINKIIDVG